MRWRRRGTVSMWLRCCGAEHAESNARDVWLCALPTTLRVRRTATCPSPALHNAAPTRRREQQHAAPPASRPLQRSRPSLMCWLLLACALASQLSGQILRAWHTEVERVLLALSGSPAKRVDAATTGGDGGRRRVSLHTSIVAISDGRNRTHRGSGHREGGCERTAGGCAAIRTPLRISASSTCLCRDIIHHKSVQLNTEAQRDQPRPVDGPIGRRAL